MYDAWGFFLRVLQEALIFFNDGGQMFDNSNPDMSSIIKELSRLKQNFEKLNEKQFGYPASVGCISFANTPTDKKTASVGCISFANTPKLFNKRYLFGLVHDATAYAAYARCLVWCMTLPLMQPTLAVWFGA